MFGEKGKCPNLTVGAAASRLSLRARIYNYTLEATAMEKDLTCTICNQQYRQNNVPRLLPKCGHSFCQNCIKSSMESIDDSQSVRITCPEDAMEMTFEDRDINNFPKNIALVKLLGNKPPEVKKKDESFKDGSLNQSNIAKHSAHEVDEEDNELVAVINESTKGTENNFNDNPSAEIELDMEDTCLIHQKPLEIVCIRDRTKICSTCAIFGDHKGHEFKSMDEVAKDKQRRCDGILQLIDKKQALHMKICGKEAKDEVTKTLIARKDTLCKEVKDRFAKLSELLKTVEKRTLDKINKNMSAIEEKLLDEMKIPEQLTKKYGQWEERAYRQINCFDGDNFEEQLQVLNYERTKDQLDVMDQGNRIITEIEKVVGTMDEQRSEVVNGVSLQFSNDVERKIQDCVTVKEPGKKPAPLPLTSPTSRQSAPAKFKQIYEPMMAPPKRSITQHQPTPITHIERTPIQELQSPGLHNPDDFLLEAHEDIGMEQEQPIVREIREPLVHIPAITIKEPEVAKPQTSFVVSPTSFNAQSPGETSRKMADKANSLKQSSFVFEKMPVKKKPKLKLPEKYEKIFDGIINDQLETVDFTNAELGDQVLIQIAEYMRGKKIKTLKLIRNKLTDEGLDKMLPHFGGIITLNLSQNVLTDRFIDHLINHLPKLPLLKSLILSQNKIKQRAIKTRLEEIKKYEIVVSL